MPKVEEGRELWGHSLEDLVPKSLTCPRDWGRWEGLVQLSVWVPDSPAEENGTRDQEGRTVRHPGSWDTLWRAGPLRTSGCLPGSSVHGTLLARILEWVAMPSSRDPPHQDQTASLMSSFLEKETATRSRNFAWKILWMEEPGRLQSMGSQRVGHFIFFLFSMSSLPLAPPGKPQGSLMAQIGPTRC